MNPKLEDILQEADLDRVLKWQKLNDQQIRTIEDEKNQEPDWSTDEEEPAPKPE